MYALFLDFLRVSLDVCDRERLLSAFELIIDRNSASLGQYLLRVLRSRSVCCSKNEEEEALRLRCHETAH